MKKQLFNMKNRICNKMGFTLAETLVTILILLMVSSIVVAGIPAAINAYNKVVVASNAEILLSTTISALRNELGTARDIKTSKKAGESPETIITYYNASISSKSKLYLSDGTNDKEPDNTVIKPAGTIVYQRYTDADTGFDYSASVNSPVFPLVSSAAATKDLYVTYDHVVYNAARGIITFYGLEVKTKTTNKVMASLPKKDDGTPGTYSIRIVAY